ncbi:MAG: TIGR04283 family arsenosugar biosynthesis glycosyltransferase [Acidobacteria bacterium]|nr:TIGR04283 family arsenosugar biosynthesis glycosyltransferase [Acidobacteriota bacterium]
MQVSIVIPVLRDSVQLDGLLASLARRADDAAVEIIVANGDADDGAVAGVQARHAAVRWVASPPGRGLQMNAGAAVASGRWLLFLHADTRLDERWLDALRQAESHGAVGGAFRFTLDSPRRVARVIERGVAWRTRWLGLPYGDQGLFVRRDAFEALGGYRPYPLMEDIDLVRRLRRRGTLRLSPLPIRTSARRWERDGWVRRSLRNLTLVALYFGGVSPRRLARRYDARSDPSSTAPARPRWLGSRPGRGRTDAA